MITDFRINAKGELEGKIIPPAKWEEMYTKADMIAMLTELKKEILELKSYESADGQDLVMLADIGILLNQKINKLREGEL